MRACAISARLDGLRAHRDIAARRDRGHVRRAGVLCFLGIVALAPSAAADPSEESGSPPSTSLSTEDRTRLAAEQFARGRTAFVRGDFRLAGRSFDAAFAFVPHHDALWNAAQAWESGGELARAANRYAAYLRLAPDNARDRAQATSALATAIRKLGRVHVFAQGFDDPRVDGEPIDTEVVYVYPGTHEVSARRGGARVSREVSVGVQEDRSVSLGTSAAPEVLVAKPESTPQATAPDRAPPSAVDHAETPSGSHRVLSPWFVVGGGALTLASAGMTTYFAARTSDEKRDFDRAPSAELLESGRDHQTLTNVGLGVTIGLAAITACAALFFVDWGSPSKRTARVDTPRVRVTFP